MRTNNECNELSDKIFKYIEINQPCSFRFTANKKGSKEGLEEAEKIYSFLNYRNTGYIATALRELLKNNLITREMSKTTSPMYIYSISPNTYIENNELEKTEIISNDLNEDLIKSIIDEHTKNFKSIRKEEIDKEKAFREEAIKQAVDNTKREMQDEYSKIFNRLNQESYERKEEIEKLKTARQILKDEYAKVLTHSEEKYKSNLEKSNKEIIRLNAEIKRLKNNLARLSTYRDSSLKKFGADYSKASLSSLLVNEDISELSFKQDGSGKSLYVKK